MAGDRQVSEVLFSMIVSGMCQSCDSNVVLYSSEMSGVRHVSGVLFAMVVRWQVSDMCKESCSLW